MRVRVEDRKVVDYLAVIGAVSGIFIALLAVIGEWADATDEYRTEQQWVEDHLPIQGLEKSEVDTRQQKLPEEVLDEAKVELGQHQAHLAQLEQGFWVRLSTAGLIGICTGSALLGAILGYGVSWSLCWILTLVAFVLIRGLYKGLRTVAPGVVEVQPTFDPQVNLMSKRAPRRILPPLIRWVILLAAVITLVLLLVKQGVISKPWFMGG